MRTFGVEEELLLVDAETGGPVPRAPEALAAVPDDAGAPAVDSEIQQEMLETQTRPQLSASRLLEDVVAGRALADALAAPLGARAVALAMSPLHVTPHPTDQPRYQEMMRRFGATATGTLVCGCHVHVSIESKEEGIGVLDRIRTWLPVLLGLSANSPYAHGVDTGYASYRFITWRQWQSAGPTEVFGSLAAYEAFEDLLVATGVILDHGMLYLDARLSRKQPTVEVRIADVCLDARDTVVLASLVRALVDTAAAEWRAGVAPTELPAAVLRLAGWQAALTGASGRLPHPVHGRESTAGDAVAALLDHVAVALEANGDDEHVRAGVRRILATGGGAGRQRATFARTGRLRDVVLDAVDATHIDENRASAASSSESRNRLL
ncbi:glutamate--cysteine ligase [Leifsonia sp. NPDC058292]|uniref:glutamate--cysteine ligase n=1 Tax=Leifsonia sp. NPDC058292 TaxID=3346428 RepID=UPI0036DA50FF